ncbi:MAG: serine hydrolase [Gemmatimonadaceae bacterium]|nr:serine hydrolase [Gemmatimonadaceae bacterium]
MDALRDRIAERASRQPGALVGVYYHDMASADGLTLNADSVFHAASTMKVPVMIEYFRGIDSGRFAPGQQIQLTNRFASIVDGSPYQLDAADDSDSALYARVGGSIAVQELVERMITRSSNLATNAVIALVDARRAQATARALGATDMVVLRGVEDNLAFRAGLNNTTSARDLGALFRALARGTAAAPASTRAMLDMLQRQEFNDEIPAGLPPGTPVAHKTGWITGILHDAALVRPAGRAPFVLVVLTRGIPEQRDAQRLIADIAALVWGEVASGGAGDNGRALRKAERQSPTREGRRLRDRRDVARGVEWRISAVRDIRGS